MMFELHVCSKKGALLKAFALGDRQEVIVGRDPSCDIQINSIAVSREHCAIESEGGDMFLRDLGSKSGVFVDGHKVDKVRLEDGVIISVGPAVLKFFDAGL
ncbi:MAG: FHA domain-containing protein [Phycisphaerales bacterium]